MISDLLELTSFISLKTVAGSIPAVFGSGEARNLEKGESEISAGKNLFDLNIRICPT